MKPFKRKISIFKSLGELKSICTEDDFRVNDGFGQVYVVEYGKNVKIGLSTRLWTRLHTLESNVRIYSGEQLGMIAFCEPIPDFKLLEKHLHLRFFNNRLSAYGELFNVSFLNAVDALQHETAEPFPIETLEYNHKRKTNANKHKWGENKQLRNYLKNLYKDGEA